MATKTKSLIMVSAAFSLRSLAAFLTVALLLLSAITVTAQERTGNIGGIVKDHTGGVLPGVAVTITNKVSNRIVTTKTDAGGTYSARELEPGQYTVKFELTSFFNVVVQDVLLLLGKTIAVNTTMQVGAVEQVVEVSSGATLIDTISTAVSHNVTEEEMSRMPKARSFQDVALTSPSVNSGKIEGGIQVNGASAAENNFMIDGLSVTGVISAVTKSGGNQFHGEAHWYNYGSNLNAGPTTRLLTNPSDEISTTYSQDIKIKDHNNEFGGSLGGPILKDKLFFFTSITPNWRRQEANIKFQDGPSTFNSDRNSISMFNKLSWDPINHIRTNFSWLYTTQKRTSLIPAFTGYCAD